ncbi:transglutaminase-like cysteine peptidase [Cohaesibacter intestini]|uniref:transglutaminase-like cysteine peptidase n=1 Tax=Cohaesibacter intestini TaxID=2211145 RepID=UPI0013004D77|nr:transglutaminase-like cysteine peptidase [Cohaesibacter intestini]
MFRLRSYRNQSRILQAATLVAGLLVGASHAAATGATDVSLSGLGMRVVERTSPPAGHVHYCAREPDACARYGQGAVILTQTSWQQLVTINSVINKSIAPKADGRVDQWSVYVSAGDCEDYALTKQRELLSRGWPSDALLVTTAYLPDGTYHAVLVVRTDRGEFVLDNLDPLILPWQKVKYRWNKRQAVGNPHIWQTIVGAPKARDGQSVARLRPALEP